MKHPVYTQRKSLDSSLVLPYHIPRISTRKASLHISYLERQKCFSLLVHEKVHFSQSNNEY
jgi:hypothetical protein